MAVKKDKLYRRDKSIKYKAESQREEKDSEPEEEGQSLQDEIKKIKEVCKELGAITCFKNYWSSATGVLPEWFEKFTGHDPECLSSFEKFVKFMHQPTDAASLGVGRMFFGLMMLIDIPDERSGGELDIRWGEPRDCRFPLLPFLYPLSLPKMTIVYFVMWLGALGITLGYRYRTACLMFVIPYWYIFLLDKSVWNNHSYLYGLLGLLFSCTDAHRYCSIDALKNPSWKPVVPFWNYFILKFQFFLLYFYAGVKKFCPEWLSGYAMSNLGHHWVFAPFSFLIGPQLTSFLIVHWFACIFDLTIALWMIYEPTRIWATPFCAMFHLMNSRLFRIGMFPWTCLVEMPLFYKVDWPRKVMRSIESLNRESEKEAADEGLTDRDANENCSEAEDQNFVCSSCRQKSQPGFIPKERLTVLAILCFILIQLFLPFSHSITKGYNGWTDGPYGYSWDMMVHAWDTVLVSVKVVDNSNQKQHFLEPFAFTESDRWTKHPDMALQYAHCIGNRLRRDVREGRNHLLKSEDLSIYFDVWTSMNGRFQQRFYNSSVDLLRARWRPLEKTAWVLPLLEQFNGHRPHITKLTEDVLSWNNYTDVLFIADFPGFNMDHFIPSDLRNVTLTVLEGAVMYRKVDTNTSKAIYSSQSITGIEANAFHNIQVTGDTPASYMFTYLNYTMQLLDRNGGEVMVEESKPKLPLWAEFKSRAADYKRFFIHVGNAFLHEVYGVPMPRRLRKLDY